MSRLRVLVDGRPLADDEARALWQRFSAHMDVHRGDFAGFAGSEGYASASVAVAGDVPTLTLATGAASRPPKAASPKPGKHAKPSKKRSKKPTQKGRVDVSEEVPRRKKR